MASPWWVPALLARSSYFAVRQVEVSGAHYVAPEDVARLLGLGADASVWQDLDDFEARLRLAPFLAAAEVKRRLPGTLVVTVAEVEPVALADGPAGLVAVAESGEPLPYDVGRGPVDAPVIGRADTALVRGLAVVQRTDPGLYAGVSAASLDGGLLLDLGDGRIRLDVPVTEGAVRAVALVRRDLAARGLAWREVDGRFRGWVVVRQRGERAGGGAS